MAFRSLMHVSPLEFLEALAALRRPTETRWVDGLIREATEGEQKA